MMLDIGDNNKWALLKYFNPRPTNGLRVLDLFCGCGGLSLGFQRAGYEIIAGVDFEQAALATFEKNFGLNKALHLDVSDSYWSERLKQLGHIDVILAGPPCQGFSLTGPRNPDDTRNQLYKAVFDAARVLRPKAILIENVKGMATLYNGEIRSAVLSALKSLNLEADSGILNAANFGVPQNRERLFFLATRNKDVSLPKPIFIEPNFITCGEALSDLPSLMNGLGKEYTFYDSNYKNPYQQLMKKTVTVLSNHVGTNHSELVKNVIRLVPEGKNYKALPVGVGESRKFNEAWTRYDRNKPSRTIDTGHRNHFHYEYDRVPTIRENARLQSFPDDFIFLGNKTQQNRQVGNAVPVLLAQAIATHLNDVLFQ